MVLQKRRILSLGLGRYSSQDPNGIAQFGPDASSIAQTHISNSISQASALGFELIPCDVNTKDPEDTLKRFRTAMMAEEGVVVGVNFGFGLRGHKEHTALFEKMVNEVWEMRPGCKIMFSTGPDTILEGIKRMFPN